MPALSGNTPVRLFVGSQPVRGYMGNTIIAYTLPGAPTIIDAVSEGSTTLIEFSPPANDGGDPNLSYIVWIQNQPRAFPDDFNESTQWIFYEGFVDAHVQVTAINTLGAGPKSAGVDVRYGTW